MADRKVLNRYYPVDYDPANIPKLKTKQKEANRLWGIRVMAPFNMRCNTCGEYIYKGKKFNSRMERVLDKEYLGIQIHRFYIRCPRCVAVLAFRTDPENCDYTCEAGATRNFEAAKTLLDMEKKKQEELEAEEAANPMKVLENRTKQSRNEMDTIEAINELRELNSRNEKVDHQEIIRKQQLFEQELVRLQKEEEDRMIRDLFGGDANAMNGDDTEDGSSTSGSVGSTPIIRRLEEISDDDDDEMGPPKSKISKPVNPTELLTQDSVKEEKTAQKVSKPILGSKPTKSQKALLSGLVIKKKTTPQPTTEKTENSSNSNNTLCDSQSTKIEPGSNDSNDTKSLIKSGTDTGTKQNKSEAGALSMLGGYDYSSSDHSEED